MNKNSRNPVAPINRLQILIGIVSLLIGVLVYLIDRPPELTYFIYRYGVPLSLHNILPKIFGPFGGLLPEFIHVFSFILITAGILSWGKRGYLIISMGWLAIDCAFELGQRYSTLALKIVPGWFKGIPILEAVDGYFRVGTFDLYDIIAIFLGAAAAYLLLLATKRSEKGTIPD